MEYGVLFILTDASVPLASGNNVLFVARVNKPKEPTGDNRNEIFLVCDVRKVRDLYMHALG